MTHACHLSHHSAPAPAPAPHWPGPITTRELHPSHPVYQLMDPPESKKRKILRDGSFLQQRYYILQTLGYYNEGNTQKLKLREALETRFKEIVHPATHGPPSMNILEFTNDCLSRGYSSRFATAGFRLLVDNGDLIWDHEVCRMLSITMEEYVAFRLCLPPHFPSPSPVSTVSAITAVVTDEEQEKEEEEHEAEKLAQNTVVSESEDMLAVKEILRQWHLRLVFYMYDTEGTGRLLLSDLKHLVSDLVQEENHTDHLVGQICVASTLPSYSTSSSFNPSAEASSFSIDDLSKKASLDVFDANHCSLSKFLAPNSLTNTTISSSVLDTRAITSRIPSALSTLPPPRSRLSSMQHGQHSLNTTEVHLPDSMRPLSDWRGLLVNRSTPAFEIANIVVANAHRMMLRTYSENDIQDSEWMTAGTYSKSTYKPENDISGDNHSSWHSNSTQAASTSSRDETSTDTETASTNNNNTNINNNHTNHDSDKLRCLHELLSGPNDHPPAPSENIDVKPLLWKIASLCAETRRILSAQPIVLTVPQPCKVFGDIHGQLRDLLLLFREYGFPNNKGGDVDAVKYVFDGDFVDRGAHQLEVVVLLFALKVAYPGCVFLLRGNHEMRDQNMAMGESGFFSVCRNMFKLEYADKLFLLIHMVFDWLPLAAVVAKRVLVLHGGIGDGSWTLADLDKLQRPIGHDFMNGKESKAHDLLIQVLWSDPTEGHDNANPGVHCNERGKGIMTFSNDITQSFCRRNNLSHIIRGHQYVVKGYKILHGGRVLTVFSARNYFDRVQNDSAIILISEDEEGNVRLKPKTLIRRLTERPF